MDSMHKFFVRISICPFENMKKIKPKAILFDMDGVLVDSIDSWWRSLNHALKHYNKKEMTKEEFREKYWGHDLYDNLERMKLSEEVGHFCNNTYHKYLDEIKIYKNVKDTLEKLNSYKKAIITNTPKDCTDQILKNFKIRKYFDKIFTSSDVTYPKPSPEIVNLALKSFNLKPSDVILVGDTNSDINAGKAAGCRVIGIKVDGDYKINSISEILKIIKI